MRIALTLLVTLWMLGCTEKSKFESVKGHWVSLDYLKEKSFSTFDIIDSTLILNQYSPDFSKLAFWPKDDLFEARYPFHEWPLAFQVYFRNDTLFQIISNDTIQFVRNNSKHRVKEELFCSSPLTIDLPESESMDTVNVNRKSLMFSLYVGRLKKGNRIDYPLIDQDSVLIQVMDVFIDPSEILAVVKQEQSKVDEIERDSMSIGLYVDKRVPISNITSISNHIHQYNENLNVYRVYIDWSDRTFRYKKI